MARYPVTSIDYALSSRLLEQAKDLHARSKSALETLRSLRKECTKLDGLSESFDADLDELLDGGHDLIGLSVASEIEQPIEWLEDAIKQYDKAARHLRPIVDQAEAWDKHFRKAWQAMFAEAFGETITKAQADESFLEAVQIAAADNITWEAGTEASRSPGTPVEWVDTGGVLKIDLALAFEHQQLFEPADEDEDEEESEDDS